MIEDKDVTVADLEKRFLNWVSKEIPKNEINWRIVCFVSQVWFVQA